MNRILIAEDEAPIANLLRTALVGAGYCCDWAADGATAADLIETQPFDLALLDIMLPQGKWLRGIGILQNTGSSRHLHYCQGTVGGSREGTAVRSGGLYRKTFRIVELLARVETVLRRFGKTGRILRLPPDIEIDTASRVVKKERCGRGVDRQGI